MVKKIYTNIDLVGNKIENVSKINQKSIGDINKSTVQLLSNAFEGIRLLQLSKNSTTTIYIQSNKSETIEVSLYNLLDTKLISSVKVGTPVTPTFLSDSDDQLTPINITTGDVIEKVLYLNIEFYSNSHEYVDLKLPSRTKWATMNIGASKPTDYGLYFAWGETQGYTKDQIGTGEGQKKFASDWSDYKFNPSHDGKTFTKYNKTDNKKVLDLEDDAAHVNMGGDWHMPTPQQIQELIDNTTSTWTTQDGINGRLFTSKKNGKSIFIPYAGDAWDGSVNLIGSDGYVWSSILSAGKVGYGQFICSHSGKVYLNDGHRYDGLSVRGVIG